MTKEKPQLGRQKGGLALAALLFILVFCEAAVRVLGVETSPGSSWKYHQDLGWTQIPEDRQKYPVAGESVEVLYNSLGFRDVEHKKEKPAGTNRILIIGDSFTAAAP